MTKWKLMLTLSLIITVAFSQNHEIYGSIGYDYPTPTSIVGRYYPQNFIELNKSTYSEGYKVKCGYTFLVNSNFGLDLSIGYLQGIKNKLFSEDLFGYNSYSIKHTNKNYSITPSIILKTEIGSISPFVKIGASVNFIKLKLNYDIKDYHDSYWRTREENYSNDYTIGLLSVIGLTYKISDTIFFLTEIQHSSISFFPTKDKLYIDGKYVNTFTLYDKYDKYHPGSDAYGETSAFPFNALGFSFGIGFSL